MRECIQKYSFFFERIFDSAPAASASHSFQATNFDEFENEGWIIKGDPTELCKRFSTWEPRVGKLCALVGSVSMRYQSSDVEEDRIDTDHIRRLLFFSS